MNKDKNNNDSSLAFIFGKNLIEIRKSNQLTQYGLADKIGITRSSISYYESRAKNPSLEIVEKISKLFNIPAEKLITLPSENEDKKTGPISKLEKLFMRAKKQSPFKQKIIVNVLEATLKT